MEEAGDPGGAVGEFIEPPERIVAQRGAGGRVAAADETVLDVVSEARGSVAGQVAVRVVREARRSRRSVLVEPVGSVSAIDRDMAGPRERVVAFGRLDDLSRRVVGESVEVGVSAVPRVVAQPGQAAGGIVAVGGEAGGI